MFEMLHFRDSDKILEKKDQLHDVQLTMEYIDTVMSGSLYKRELLRLSLDEMDWQRDREFLRVFENRRYLYKGFKNGVAIDGNLSAYEYILEGLLKLQIGFNIKKVDVGVLLLTSRRSQKSPYGNVPEMVQEDLQFLFPTISLPVCVCLFDTGEPFLPE